MLPIQKHTWKSTTNTTNVLQKAKINTSTANRNDAYQHVRKFSRPQSVKIIQAATRILLEELSIDLFIKSEWNQQQQVRVELPRVHQLRSEQCHVIVSLDVSGQLITTRVMNESVIERHESNSCWCINKCLPMWIGQTETCLLLEQILNGESNSRSIQIFRAKESNCTPPC